MCYLARQSAAEPERGAASPVPGSERIRPRWAGAAAATLIAAFAVAALVAPSPTAPALPQAKQAATAPVVTRAIEMPTAATVEKMVLGDDAVPTRTDSARASARPCTEDL